jgi:signal peptidase I
MLQALFQIIPLPVILFTLSILTGIIVWNDKQKQKKTPRAADEKMSWWLDLSHAIFPVVTFVFLLRSFLFEPFVIPSGSMLPTLEIGDFIIVNKYTYGIRLPIIEHKIMEVNQPQRGDVVVFRYPLQPSIDYIKRLVGLPGDIIEYKNKQLFINGKLAPSTRTSLYTYQEGEDDNNRRVYSIQKYASQTDKVKHDILIAEEGSSLSLTEVHQDRVYRACTYAPDGSGFRCKVPSGHYFMMGDNRDHSADSRYWGFVPDDHLRGKAILIWFNWQHFKNFDFGRFAQRL